MVHDTSYSRFKPLLTGSTSLENQYKVSLRSGSAVSRIRKTFDLTECTIEQPEERRAHAKISHRVAARELMFGDVERHEPCVDCPRRPAVGTTPNEIQESLCAPLSNKQYASASIDVAINTNHDGLSLETS
jgi:hypothetical protein